MQVNKSFKYFSQRMTSSSKVYKSATKRVNLLDHAILRLSLIIRYDWNLFYELICQIIFGAVKKTRKFFNSKIKELNVCITNGTKEFVEQILFNLRLSQRIG